MKIVEGRVRVAASDVANFLACQELTQLDLRAARGVLRPPHPRDLGFEDLVRRGEEHERAVLKGFAADGWEVADLGGAGGPASSGSAPRSSSSSRASLTVTPCSRSAAETFFSSTRSRLISPRSRRPAARTWVAGDTSAGRSAASPAAIASRWASTADRS